MVAAFLLLVLVLWLLDDGRAELELCLEEATSTSAEVFFVEECVVEWLAGLVVLDFLEVVAAERFDVTSVE